MIEVEAKFYNYINRYEFSKSKLLSTNRKIIMIIIDALTYNLLDQDGL